LGIFEDSSLFLSLRGQSREQTFLKVPPDSRACLGAPCYLDGVCVRAG
jgi:hypothetical protein